MNHGPRTGWTPTETIAPDELARLAGPATFNGIPLPTGRVHLGLGCAPDGFISLWGHLVEAATVDDTYRAPVLICARCGQTVKDRNGTVYRGECVGADPPPKPKGDPLVIGERKGARRPGAPAPDRVDLGQPKKCWSCKREIDAPPGPDCVNDQHGSEP